MTKQERLFNDEAVSLDAADEPAVEERDVTRYPERLKKETHVIFATLEETKRDLPSIVAKKLGGNASVTNLSQHKDVLLARVGITVSYLYYDQGKPIVKFVQHPTVTTLRAAPSGEKFAVAFPSYLDFAKQAERVTKTRHVALEVQVLESVHERLAKIPTVVTTLTPITNLLHDLVSHEKVGVAAFRASHGKPEQSERYITFLKGLGLLAREKEMLLKGPRLDAHLKAKPTDDLARIMGAILGEVLQRGQDQLQDYLRLTGLVPFLRIANSYYTPAHRLHHLITVSPDQLNRFQAYIYNRRTDPLKWRGQIRQVSDAEIVEYEPKSEKIVGVDDVWQDFEARARPIEA